MKIGDFGSVGLREANWVNMRICAFSRNFLFQHFISFSFWTLCIENKRLWVLKSNNNNSGNLIQLIYRNAPSKFRLECSILWLCLCGKIYNKRKLYQEGYNDTQEIDENGFNYCEWIKIWGDYALLPHLTTSTNIIGYDFVILISR